MLNIIMPQLNYLLSEPFVMIPGFVVDMEKKEFLRTAEAGPL